MRRAVGKGLFQLMAEQGDRGLLEVEIGLILPNPRQPRGLFNESSLEDLAASIREFGIIQPLVLRATADQHYELVAGERRLRAAKIAGLTTVPAIVRAAGNQASLELALIENIQREDINALDCARAYQLLANEFDLKHEEIADRVGKSRTTVSNTLRLLKLPPRIQDGLHGGVISEGHARALLSFKSAPEQLAIYDLILAKNLSVREVEQLAQTREGETAKKEAKASRPRDAHLVALERTLADHFASPVKLVSGPKGGKLQINYFSDEDLQRILDTLGISL